MELVSIWSIKEGQRLRFCIGWIFLTALSWLIYFVVFDYDFSTWAKGVDSSKKLIRGLAEIAGSWIVVTYSVTIGWDLVGALRDYVNKREVERKVQELRERAEREGNEEVLRFLNEEVKEDKAQETASTQ